MPEDCRGEVARIGDADEYEDTNQTWSLVVFFTFAFCIAIVMDG